MNTGLRMDMVAGGLIVVEIKAIEKILRQLRVLAVPTYTANVRIRPPA
jgi:hypothetical protein